LGTFSTTKTLGLFAKACYAFGIDTALGQLNKGKKPFEMAVFLVVLLVFLGASPPFFKNASDAENKGILGGPIENSTRDTILLATVFGGELAIRPGLDEDSGINGIGEQNTYQGSLIDGGQPIGPSYSRNVLIIYNVESGDTLSGIASRFGISLDTIINANPALRGRILRVGDKLNVLPTSGVVYKTKEDDTLESIAAYFGIPEEKIVKYNKSVNFASLGAGITIVIPGARSSGLAGGFLGGGLSDFSDNFSKPTDGFNWGKLHHYNAVDIANSCGAPVYAAAEGLVVPDESFGSGKDGWNGGYGKFVLIEHPFGDNVRTRYAHLGKVLVEIGDYIKSGTEIGTIGQSGDASGCHLHFEVYGAENPFAR